MGRVRSCDERCHKAKRVRCYCWCHGWFHGVQGDPAREAFRVAWDEAHGIDKHVDQWDRLVDHT